MDAREIMLINKLRQMDKEQRRDNQIQRLVQGADALIAKNDEINEVENFFTKINSEGMQKAKGEDPQFLEFIIKNHIKPTKLKLEGPKLKRTNDLRQSKKSSVVYPQSLKASGSIKKAEP